MPLEEEHVSSAWQKGIFDQTVVFCTGGSGDICSAQIRALVHLGANACIVGRNLEKTERVAKDLATARVGAKVLGYGAVDVRDIKSLEAAVSRCVAELGGIDFVIAGAAGNFLSPFMQLSTNAFRAVIEIDLMGAWNTAKATIPHLIKSASKRKTGRKGSRPGGRIIFISSTLQYTGMPLNTHGVVAKAGIDALAAQIAIELGPLGITSNVIAPGPIQDTEGVKRLFKQENGNGFQKSIPSGRFGLVKEIADAAVYLLSDAGNYVNGATIVVDGGAWRTSGPKIGNGFLYPDDLPPNRAVSPTQRRKEARL